MSTDLRSKVIRLAHANPALRADLLPLLKQAATQKQALDIKKMLAVLFAGVEPHVKNYPHFIRVLAEDLESWWGSWGILISDWTRAYSNEVLDDEPQVGGQTYAQTLESPAEYAEYDSWVLKSFYLAVGFHLSLRRWPTLMTRLHHNLISNPEGFEAALTEMVDNPRSAKVFGKYLLMKVRQAMGWGEYEIGGDFFDFSEKAAKEISLELSMEKSKYGEVSRSQLTDDMGSFKIVGDGITFTFPEVWLEVSVSPPDLTSYDPY